MDHVGTRIQSLRRAQGMTQTALAGDSLSPSYISLIEAGKRVPTTDALRVIARSLGTSTAFLQTGRDGDEQRRAELDLEFARLSLANGSVEAALERLLPMTADDLSPHLRIAREVELGNAYESLGRLEEAAARFEAALRASADAQAWLEHARAATTLTFSFVEAGDLARAVDVATGARQRVEDAGLVGTDEHIRLVSTLMWALQTRGDLVSAQLLATELTQLAERSGSPSARGSVYWNAALVAEERGDVAEALSLARRALALIGEVGPARDLPRLHLLLGWVLLRGDDPDPRAALAELDRAEAGLQDVPAAVDLAYLRTERARAWLLLGEVERASAEVHAALDGLGVEPRLERCEALVVLADVHFARHEDERALDLCRQATGMLALMQAKRSAARVWRSLGERFQRGGQFERASKCFLTALTEVGLPGTPNPGVADLVAPLVTR